MPHNPNNPNDTNHKISSSGGPLADAEAKVAAATGGVAASGGSLYFSNTRGQYSAGRGVLPEKKIFNDAQFEEEIYRILGDDQMRRDLAEDLYRDRSIYNAAGMDTDSTVVNGLLASVKKYKASSDSGKVAYVDWLAKRAENGRPAPEGSGGGGGGGGGYSGPVQSISSTVMDDRDVEITLNDFATDMLGRNLTDKELKKYSKKFKKQDALPQVSLRTPNGPGQVTSVTQEQQSRESIVQDILQENPDYAKNVINTDVLDMFKKRLGI
jgi:hypothetical protein